MVYEVYHLRYAHGFDLLVCYSCIVILSIFRGSIHPYSSGSLAPRELYDWYNCNTVILQGLGKIVWYLAPINIIKFIHYASILRCIVDTTSYVNKYTAGTLMFSLICSRTKGWSNIRDPRDLWCHHAHYDITVMREAIRHTCLWRQYFLLRGLNEMHLEDLF